MAVENVSFRVREGQIKALIGPNGAGKTTLFNLISGNLRPTAGRVFFLDELVTGLKCHEVAQRGISRTFQTIKLSSTMTVLENVMLGMHTRTRAGFIAGMLNLPWTWSEERTIRDTSHAFLELFSLGNVAQVEVGSLPFGKQRAVEFARALAAEPKLLLLDEPASGLNLHETAELSELIVRIRDMGITILLVEHDMSLVMGISD
ncbi:MAG TPA: ABC transporter ATP-binding protein, partial [Spirochaetia bacterium]|nr:ABC transporter ATP-binding protein [Spirochaetia bacterium]